MVHEINERKFLQTYFSGAFLELISESITIEVTTKTASPPIKFPQTNPHAFGATGNRLQLLIPLKIPKFWYRNRVGRGHITSPVQTGNYNLLGFFKIERRMYYRACDGGVNSFLSVPLFYRCSAVPLSKWNAYPGRLRRRLRGAQCAANFKFWGIRRAG